jgi:hypothetical protein
VLGWGRMASQPNPEMQAFNATLDHLLSVSPEEMKRRMEAYREESLKNPNRRGPKPRPSKKRTRT